MGLVVLTAACGNPPLTPPSKGGEPWVELESEHFTLVSDLSDKDANRVIGGFEEMYAQLGSVIFAAGEVPSFHTDAIVFRSHYDAKQFLGDDVGAAYSSSLANDLEPTPTVIASGSLSPLARITFAHELTHRFNNVALGWMPLWLNEGLAQYYSTIRAEDGKPVLGETDPRFMCAAGSTRQSVGDIVCNYQILKGRTLPKASELVRFDRAEFYADQADANGLLSFEQKEKRARHYGAAWLLVHMLMNEKLEYADLFRAKLAGNPSANKGEALNELITDVPPGQLDSDFQAYLQKAIPWRQHHASPPAPLAKLKRRELPEHELFVWWARLDPFGGDKWARALQHLEAAKKASPAQDGRALFWLGRHAVLRKDSRQGAERYNEALAREPANPQYLFGLLDLYWNEQAWADAARDEKVIKLIAELAKTARSARQHNAVAAHRLFSGDVGGALTSSAEACKLGPDCAPCFHNRAAALFASGSVQEAVQAELDAINRLPESSAGSFAALFAQALDFYQRAARDPASVDGAPRPGLIAP